MSVEPLWVFCYDISRNRARRRAAALLEKCGTRVQESVFEIRLGAVKAEGLLRALQRECAAGDSVRMYGLTEEARARSRAVGGSPIAEATEFWLL